MKKIKVAWIFVLVMAFALAMWNVSDAEAKKIVIRCAHNGNASHPFQKAYEKFKEVLEAETKGAVEVQIFPNAQLGTEEEVTQMVKMGTVAITTTCTGGLAGFVPEIELFNLPFIFRDLDHFYRVVDGPVGKMLAKKIEDKLNSVSLGWWFCGIRNIWNKERPIKTPADLEGLKIRTMGSPIFVDTWNALGAQATPMNFGELYTGLQQGVVDGAECDMVDLWVEKFYEVTKYVSFTKHMFLANMLIMSKKHYDKFPPAIQTTIWKAAEAAKSVERKALEDMTNSLQSQLEEKGLKFFEIEQKPFIEAVKGVYKKNAEKVGGMELIEMIQSQ
ncbi:MAG TPA: TRAP transporter substrate-binding protein [Desulfatiglandales bacterium]|nr:TRAP transporter substrate-binding protein [Desulfatiglandales bacterium]